MYGLWNSYFQSLWQESLSDSYKSATCPPTKSSSEPSPLKAEEATPAQTQAVQSNNYFSQGPWPFDHALCLLNDQLEISEVTANFSRVTGLALPKKPIELLSILREDGHAQLLYCLQQVAFAETETAIPMIRARLKSRPQHWVHLSGIRQDEGIVISMRDITSEMTLERELVRARINADLAQRARSEFLGRMSHELRTPLNAVLGFSQMIDEEVSGPMNHPLYEEYLGNVRQSGQQLLDKINNLLAISEVELGEISLVEETVSVAALLRSASEHHQHFAFCKDVQLTLAVEDLRCPYVKIDRAVMAKALSKLIENAISCTPSGGIVRMECSVDAKGCVIIAIKDSGVGMNESLVKCLSDYFEGRYSSANYYERIPLGTGLMLAREYAEIHDAKLEVSSERGKGTVFSVRLPAHRRARGTIHSLERLPEQLLEAFAL